LNEDRVYFPHSIFRITLNFVCDGQVVYSLPFLVDFTPVPLDFPNHSAQVVESEKDKDHKKEKRNARVLAVLN
jgi:hypothetical protein